MSPNTGRYAACVITHLLPLIAALCVNSPAVKVVSAPA